MTNWISASNDPKILTSKNLKTNLVALNLKSWAFFSCFFKANELPTTRSLLLPWGSVITQPQWRRGRVLYTKWIYLFLETLDILAIIIKILKFQYNKQAKQLKHAKHIKQAKQSKQAYKQGKQIEFRQPASKSTEQSESSPNQVSTRARRASQANQAI